MAYESGGNDRNNKPSGKGWFWESYQDAGWRRKVTTTRKKVIKNNPKAKKPNAKKNLSTKVNEQNNEWLYLALALIASLVIIAYKIISEL